VKLPNGGSLGVVIFSAVVEITVSLTVDLRHDIFIVLYSKVARNRLLLLLHLH
jgi:hypothetical protein